MYLQSMIFSRLPVSIDNNNKKINHCCVKDSSKVEEGDRNPSNNSPFTFLIIVYVTCYQSMLLWPLTIPTKI